MKPCTLSYLILYLPEGCHGGACHSAEEHGGDRDPKHHGGLGAAGALA